MNSKIVLYHGSEKIIRKPIYGFGNENNDYGQGFYCTENLDLAKEWACLNNTDGYANKYVLEMNNLSVLSLTGGNYHILNWLYVLLENRKFSINTLVAVQAKKYINNNFAIDYKNYDVIKGYRADDSYFSFAKAFLNNTISIQQLEKAMVLGKLGEQIVIMSEKAFGSIKYVDSTFVPKEIYYPKSNARDNYARNEFAKEKNRGLVLEENYMIDIMREEWKNDDDRLQRVVLG